MGSSCKEDIDTNDGPIASSEAVLNSVCYRLEASQLVNLKVGEASVAAKSVAYFSGNSKVVEAHRLQVLSEDRETCNTSGGPVPCNRYEMFEELEYFDTQDVFHFERQLLLPVVENSEAAQIFKVARGELPSSDGPEAQDSTIDQEICYLTEDLYQEIGIKMTFHNFSKKRFSKAPPPAVKDRENCGGLDPCVITGTEYQFDQLFISDDGSRFKRHFIYEVATNVPFTSRYMNRCITHSIPQHFDDNHNGNIDEGEIRIVPVHECRQVRDFQFGS
ncbi:MAG: hypothetical protein KDD37_02670 [Bdellovibrionales bacterium]|nr:hypothetical protein [Bdellovibrionales bacterium]